MRRRFLILIPVAAVALFALCALLSPDREEQARARFWADREQLQTAAQEILVLGSAEGVQLPAGWDGAELYRDGVHTVEFSLGSGGFGSETVYWGINYVPSNSSFVGFQGQQWDYWKSQGDGRLYYDPEGDNTCYVKALDECWYYYEMRF